MRPAALLKRALIFLHRWMGVALSVIFMLWFVSGIVMMYWTYPEVSAADRVERLPALDPARITVSAEQALATLGQAELPGRIQLTSVDGRPAYRFGGERDGRGGAIVYADTGAEHRFDQVDEAMSDRAAAAWTGRPVSEAEKVTVDEVDQWTVGGLAGELPLTKYSWPDGQQVYVNGSSAEVVQYTTTSSRVWAYLGAIPHWMYFTPLRKHQPQWLSFVIWSSLIGTIAALIGVIVIIWMYSPRKRYRHAGKPTSIPYRGWKRWHAIAGLFFGVVTTTWAFSGMLSLGPFPIMDKLTEATVPPRSGARGPNIAAALRGREPFGLAAFAARNEKAALTSLSGFGARELEYTSFAGQPVYLATDAHGDTRIVPVHGEPMDAFDTAAVMQVIRDAAGANLAELRIQDEYDAYYLDRRGERPLPVIHARMNDAVGTRVYVDPQTARVVGNYSRRGWVNRWLYHGLHSLDFPWLYKYRPLWDIVVITLMLGGTALCVTSLVLTYRVLAKKFAAAIRSRFTSASDDLPLEAKA